MGKNLTMDTKVSAPAGGKALASGFNKGQITGGNGTTSDNVGAKMVGKSLGSGYNKGQITGGTNTTSPGPGFSGSDIIPGKI